MRKIEDKISLEMYFDRIMKELQEKKDFVTRIEDTSEFTTENQFKVRTIKIDLLDIFILENPSVTDLHDNTDKS